jgi:hypothetical protein
MLGRCRPASPRPQPGASLDPLRALFCERDECCKACAPLSHRRLLPSGPRHRQRPMPLALSERLPRLGAVPWRHSRTVHQDSLEDGAVPGRPSCPALVRSARCVARLPRALLPVWGSRATRQGRGPGMACLDAPPLAGCATHRRATPTVLAGVAARGTPARGWFSGCTRPLRVQDEGARLAVPVPPGHGAARRPVAPRATGRGGPRWGDRGSLSQTVHARRLAQGLAGRTTSRQPMQHRVRRLGDTRLLRQRALIEPVHDP